MAAKNRAQGRPRLYDSPEKMQKKIDAYFNTCEKKRKGNPLSAPPTMSGLCYYLGFEDRDSFANYANYEGFSRTVKMAKLRIENILEESLYNPSCTGTIFNLKCNFGWNDKQEEADASKDLSGIVSKLIDKLPS